ncbi:Lactonase, 7-bladed beta-propeller-domain-containing protein [Fusarium tricinctum]|uniref:Lactonase, 7-bladed beta-propeller-domain-containing protein n=1 Tax=Fusarium tricinctum TaxID=61284 RepID=A0A8K0W978_9HYPO|nr:Lactonase, 7-bladed beta-propeller-domain-containing protein [Fusarium tricinctum]
MKLLNRPRLSRNPFRDNNTRLLISTFVLATPIAVLLLHYVYQASYRKSTHWSHSHDTLDPITHARETSSLLYVASYSGLVTTLNLSLAGYRDTPLELEALATTDGCAGSPSWLTLNWHKGVLYCLDEGLRDGKNGSLTSFATSENGTLTPLAKVSTILGPVSAVMFGDWNYGLAVAHYGGSAFTAWDIQDPANITSVQAQEFNLPKPGPDPSRQEAAHPHAAVVDPTKQFILIPDLGADLIRIYGIDAEGLGSTELDPLIVAPGSGPRHLVFVVKETKTFMYLLTELANTIVGYEVVYGGKFIAFKEIWSGGIHGKGKDVPQGAAAAEIAVSPDRKFLIISSRNENTYKVPSFDAVNNTNITSDPLISFKIDGETGHLALHQDVPCGGKFPRHFAINKAGTLVAVALQRDGRIVIIERDVSTGMLGDFIAYAQLEGEVTAVVFYE